MPASSVPAAPKSCRICGTDDHGTPAELAAAEAGLDIFTYCDRQHRIQYDQGIAFGLSWDFWGRTSSRQNGELVHHFAAALEKNGLIEERVDKMVYSPADQRFLPDRYVEGTCPICGYRPARGDQCDNCGSLLDPVDLIDPYSVISGSTDLEVRDTRHLYQLHSRMADRIRAWTDAKTEWPPLARAIAYKHLDEGLIDRGITRDLSWGFPVLKDGLPRPGFEDKVYYVWFDDVIGYIGITREWADAEGVDWERWWRLDKGADDVRYVQFMGKDNVPFHSAYFPSTILGSEEPWKTVDLLKAFNWLNWYGGKFSTSQKRGVFMDQALEVASADVWRWYLTANSPEGSDTSFTWEQFQAAANRDLADVLGNFVNRILKFCESRFDGVVPAGGAPGEIEQRLFAQVSEKLAETHVANGGDRTAQVGAGAAGALGAGQRVPAGGRALERHPRGPRPRRGDRAHRDKPRGPLRAGLGADHPVCLRGADRSAGRALAADLAEPQRRSRAPSDRSRPPGPRA